MARSDDDAARALAARPDSGRLLAALRHQQPDRLPHLQLWQPTRKLYEYILEEKPYPISDGETQIEPPVTPKEHVALAQHLGIDAIVCSYDRLLKRDSVRTWSDLDQLGPSSPLTDYLTRLEQYLRVGQGKRVGIVAGFSICLYEAIRAVDVSSGGELSQAQLLVESLTNILLEQQERVIRSVLDRFTEEVTSVVFHSDNAPLEGEFGQSGLVSELTTKWAERSVALVKEYDKPVLMQVDGEVDALLPTMHNLGVDAAYLRGLASDLVANLRDQWRGEMALVDSYPANMLAQGSEQEIGEAIRDHYSELGRGGGYILATAAPKGGNYPEQRFIDLCTAICRYGYYG
jgi:hypothetical protein